MKGWAAVRPGVYSDGKRFAVRRVLQEGGARVEAPLELFDSLEAAVEFQKIAKTRRRFERAGVPIPETLRPRQTIGDVLDAYAQECRALGKSDAHLRSIATARKYLVAWRGEDANAEGLRRADLVDFVDWGRGATDSRGRALYNALVILRTALSRAELVVPALPEIELQAHEPKTINEDGLALLLKELPPGTLARTALELGLRLALREAEIRRAQVGDVDLRRRIFLVRRNKGKKKRRRAIIPKPISGPLAKILRAWMRALPPGLPPEAPLLGVESLRRGPDGARVRGRYPLGGSSLRRALEAACVRAGLPPKTTVGWARAETATLLRESGAALVDVSRGLGHADTRVTLNHYDESGRDATERWEAAKRIAARTDRVLARVGRKSARISASR